MGAVADGGVGARGVDGDGEGRHRAGLAHACRQFVLLGEARGDVEVQGEVAAGPRLADDEVAQEPRRLLVAARRAVVGAQAECAAGVGDRLPGAVRARRREPAVGGLDDLAPGATPVEAEHEASVGLSERELHLVAVAPWIGHARDRLELEVVEPADVRERLDHLALLVLELRLVGDGLPLATAALAGVAAGRGHARRRGLEDLPEPRLGVALTALRDLDADAVAGHRAAHEDDEVVDAADPLAAVGQGVDVEVEDVAGPGGHRGSVARPRARGEPAPSRRRDCPPCRARRGEPSAAVVC